MYFREQKKRKAITFSYDDGTTQDIRLIELLNKYNLKGTFNLNSELLGKPGILPWEQRISHYKIAPEDVKYIYEGHEVAAHTLTHPNLTELEEKEIIRQVEQDRINLSELVGYEVEGLAYPCGGVNQNEKVAEIIREHTGIRYCRTIISSNSFALQENLYQFHPTAYYMEGIDHLLDLGEKFLSMETEEPQIFYIWGHSFEMDYVADSWSRLEEFFSLISNREDVFYGTNHEILG